MNSLSSIKASKLHTQPRTEVKISCLRTKTSCRTSQIKKNSPKIFVNARELSRFSDRSFIKTEMSFFVIVFHRDLETATSENLLVAVWQRTCKIKL